MYRIVMYTSAAAVLAALGCHAASARSACTSSSPDCVAVGEWSISAGLGAGVRTNPLRKSSDIPLVVIPHISYYGQRFFLENLDVGYTLYDGERHTLSLIASPGYDRVFFYRHDVQNLFVNGALLTPGFVTGGEEQQAAPPTTPHHRHSTYLAGPEWTFSHGKLTGQFDALYEVTGRHKGLEVRAALATPIIESKGALVASAGLTWKSSALVDYYYGVDELYAPGAAVNPFIKLGYSLPISDRWRFTSFAHYERLASSMADSPLLGEAHVTTVFAGFVFTFI